MNEQIEEKKRLQHAYIFILLVLILIAAFLHARTAYLRERTQNSVAIEDTETEVPVPAEPLGHEAFNEDDCAIYIKNAGPKGDDMYEVSFEFSNDSNDTVTFSLAEISFNGYMCNSDLVNVLPPGTESSQTASFHVGDSFIESASLYDISATFYLSSNVTQDSKKVTVEYRLAGNETEKPEVFVRDAGNSDAVLSDDENFKVIFNFADPNGVYGYTVELYLCNLSDEETMVEIKNASFDGVPYDPFWAVILNGKTSSDYAVIWRTDDYPDQKFHDASSLEFDLVFSSLESEQQYTRHCKAFVKE